MDRSVVSEDPGKAGGVPIRNGRTPRLATDNRRQGRTNREGKGQGERPVADCSMHGMIATSSVTKGVMRLAREHLTAPGAGRAGRGMHWSGGGGARLHHTVPNGEGQPHGPPAHVLRGRGDHIWREGGDGPEERGGGCQEHCSDANTDDC